VCGGRDFEDARKIAGFLDDYLGKITVLIHGGARGADTLAGAWAAKNQIPVEIFAISRADWDHYRNRAGPRRNQLMIDKGKPDLVIAFPGGNGTADMMRRAKRHGIDLIEVPR
jgi:hypothetical protein